MKRLIMPAIIVSVMFVGVPAWGIDLPLPPSPLKVLPSPLKVLNEFNEAAGKFFGFQDPVLKAVVRAGIPDDQLPVVLFLSTLANVSPDRIIRARRHGASWMKICRKYGITPDRLYVPVPSGPPYGKAWGYYRKPKRKWKHMRLSDADIVNLVNLRLMTGYYGYSPAEVMRMREHGKDFREIHRRAREWGRRHRRGERWEDREHHNGRGHDAWRRGPNRRGNASWRRGSNARGDDSWKGGPNGRGNDSRKGGPHGRDNDSRRKGPGGP